MKRLLDPVDVETMDPSQPAVCDLEVALEQRRKLNQRLGCSRLLRYFIRSWIKPGRSYRILDLAADAGDVGLLIADWAQKRHIAVQIDAVELHPVLLEIARRKSVAYPEIDFIRADACRYCSEQTYDLVCCATGLCNYSEEDASRLLCRACELSHDKVLAFGIDRNRAVVPEVFFETTVFRAPSARKDARLAVKRSFSFSELDEVAQRAGWQNYEHRRFLPAAQALWMCKREAQPVMECELPAPDFAG